MNDLLSTVPGWALLPGQTQWSPGNQFKELTNERKTEYSEVC